MSDPHRVGPPTEPNALRLYRANQAVYETAAACTNPDIALVDAWTAMLSLPHVGMEPTPGLRRKTFIDLAAAALALAALEPNPETPHARD